MKAHPDFDKMEKLMPAIRDFQALALKHGINDIFQDNGGKILQMLLALNLEGIPGCEGNDAVDEKGREYELKSVNLWLTTSFSTNHHINIPIINKYRGVCWVFAIYESIEMRRAYFMDPDQLEPYFSKWAKKWTDEQKDINNPKIPMKFIMDNGTEIYNDGEPLGLDAAKRIRSHKAKEARKRKAEKEEGARGVKSYARPLMSDENDDSAVRLVAASLA